MSCAVVLGTKASAAACTGRLRGTSTLWGCASALTLPTLSSACCPKQQAAVPLCCATSKGGGERQV